MWAPVAGDGEEDATARGGFLAEGGGGNFASDGGEKPLKFYIDKRQETVVERVVLRPIF